MNICLHCCYFNDIETSKSCANKYQIYPALLGDDAYPIIDLLNNALDKHNAEAKKLQEEKQQALADKLMKKGLEKLSSGIGISEKFLFLTFLVQNVFFL